MQRVPPQTTLNSIFVPRVYTETYGKNSIKYISIYKVMESPSANFKSVDLKQQSRGHFYNNYILKSNKNQSKICY